MTTQVQDTSRRNIARLAGFLYLAYIVLFAFSTFVQQKPIVWDDAAATARNIAASELMFRIGYMSEIVAALLFLWTAWALYALLKPVGKNLALLFVLFNLAGVAVECVCTMIHFSALMLEGGSGYLRAFKPDQLQALSLFFLSLSGSGSMIQTLFYGAWLFPLGYLVIKSGFLPRILGVLLLLDGLSLMLCFIQLCLFPAYQKLTYPLYPVMLIAELGLALWLIIKGVKEH
ncbi:MAG TPA: DUF4386 domain-containing protein [Terracidiphilus sp.]|nr:DUF4386 domain-containing protein [Terracidiphilus sp.]